MEAEYLEFLEKSREEKINNNVFDFRLKKLLNSKNFLNNQNYIISKYIKNKVIQEYNLYERDNQIKETKNFRKIKYYSKNRNIKKDMIINNVLFSLLILSIIIIPFFTIGIFLFIIFFSILILKIGGTFSGKTSNSYLFYKDGEDIYYKLR